MMAMVVFSVDMSIIDFPRQLVQAVALAFLGVIALSLGHVR